MIRLPQLDLARPDAFPDPSHALAEPNGLLAFGGDLSATRLLAAYTRGIFPWYGQGQPVLWWSPDPRCVFDVAALHPNRSLRRMLAHSPWQFSVDHAFGQVIEACAAPRGDDDGTWIVPDMIDAYVRLHAQGHAHSVEVWDGTRLVGGIYGVAIGRLFCGESMFSRESNGSKVALMALASCLRRWGYPWLDAQVSNPHLLSLGALEMPRQMFLDHATRCTGMPPDPQAWRTQHRQPVAALLPDA
ncbi:leucyl/phenylalanyl-tRNA--protein transferase [Dyella sp. A6]|uniref:leucyl/phenylalanyl-tRNA--protein transferase n=1 Tax=Dyella aluminiiresistens TaxID=3069105 RepID=UPI002E7749B0|nr:leucyl/phenylalanyl-tRNA--protein transferase [Dyella sp. A6]